MSGHDQHSYCHEVIHKLRCRISELESQLELVNIPGLTDLSWLRKLILAYTDQAIESTDGSFLASMETPEASAAVNLMRAEEEIRSLRVMAKCWHILIELQENGWAISLANQYYAPSLSNGPTGPKCVLFCERHAKREVFFGETFEICILTAGKRLT